MTLKQALKGGAVAGGGFALITVGIVLAILEVAAQAGLYLFGLYVAWVVINSFGLLPPPPTPAEVLPA